MSTLQTLRILGRLRRHPAILSALLGVLAVLMIVVGSLGVATSTDDASRIRELRVAGGSVEPGVLVESVPVDVDGSPNGSRRTEFCPRYAYTASDGVERTILDHDDCASRPDQLAGRTARILVDDADPDTAFIEGRPARVGRSSLAIFAWSTLALGIGLVPVSVAVGVRARRLARDRASRRPRHAPSS
ncbi:DUF3592 domain-containing protein [Clavibacter michiganensis]|uniref:DUF3592 domain-containing protein n=1 Tax=Clavibacter michiganensis TaxID=28447 RepID=UPI003EBB1776